jgi:hypothetical protein
MGIGDHSLSLMEIVDQGVVTIPFGFTINGTSNPDGLKGLTVLSVVRSEAGEFLCTLADGYAPYSVFYGAAWASIVADDTDVKCQVDWSTTATDRIFTVRTMAGATQVDPTDDSLIGGHLLCKKTDR